MMRKMGWLLVVQLSFLLLHPSYSFVGVSFIGNRKICNGVLLREKTLKLSSQDDGNDTPEVLDLVFPEFKPLGCTVDQKVADGGSAPIFVTKVEPGGNAEAAGLRVGDTVIALSRNSGEMKELSDGDIDTLKSILSNLDKDSQLVVRVKRQANSKQEPKETKEEDFFLNIERARTFIPDGEVVDIVFQAHKPLGCVIDESLDESTGNPIVVTKVSQGSNAKAAGLQEGDVLIGVTGIFGEIESVLENDVEKVKEQVAACPDDATLQMRVIRGSSVLEEHNRLLLEMCEILDDEDQTIEQCLNTFLEADMEDEDEISNDQDTASDASFFNTIWESDEEQEDTQKWADVGPIKFTDDEKDTPASKTTEKKKPRPWSSRSSPSGTFVRDPTTGEMKNIDA